MNPPAMLKCWLFILMIFCYPFLLLNTTVYDSQALIPTNKQYSVTVAQIPSSVIGLNQPIEFDWKVSGISDFGEKGHTNLHCIFTKEPGRHAHIYTNSSPEVLKQIDWTKHFNMDLVSEPLDYSPDGFEGSVLADSPAIYYCRVHANDGANDVLSSIYEIEVLDPRQLLEGKSTLGELSFDKASYGINDRLILTYNAPFLDKDPESIDTVEVRLWTDTDRGGLLMILRETGNSTGVFQEILSFCAECSGTRLIVQAGDYVNVYVPETGATTFAIISGDTISLAKRIGVTDMGLVDEETKTVQKPVPDEAIKIEATLTNKQDRYQELRFIVQVKDSEDVTVLLASQKLVIPPLSSLTVSQPWTPTEDSSYTIEIMVWQDFHNPRPLAELQTLQIDMR